MKYDKFEHARSCCDVMWETVKTATQTFVVPIFIADVIVDARFDIGFNNIMYK